MKIFIEGYKYTTPECLGLLSRFQEFIDPNEAISLFYVGYCYSKTLNDCVFFLPKVILDRNNLIFGRYTPEQIVDPDQLPTNNALSKSERNFLFNFSLWIYRAIKQYRKKYSESPILRSKNFSCMDNSTGVTQNSLLDIVMSLIEFNNKHKDFLLFTVKNAHKGYNKIKWSKTITRTTPVIVNNKPHYIDPITKIKVIDTEEDLLVYYYSILNYLNTTYGCDILYEWNGNILKGGEFLACINGIGRQKLLKIRHKYYSDTEKLLWKECFSFFSQAESISSSTMQNDYLLVSDFPKVFENIIDHLIGEPACEKMKELKTGQMIDHLFPYESIIRQDDIYYIGDSKYYKIGDAINGVPEFKQYSYAKNVIQANLNLFLSSKQSDVTQALVYRDDITEGYNITPNFFIGAEIHRDLRYDIDCLNHRSGADKLSRQYRNRLFDRDTLWISHYDVNFLYVLSLYASGNAGVCSAFRDKIHAEFRRSSIEVFDNLYNFYALFPKNGNIEITIMPIFKKLNGKIFKPVPNKEMIILALEDVHKIYSADESLAAQDVEKENKDILSLLNSLFNVKPFSLKNGIPNS